MNEEHEIYFIGGPLDMTKQVVAGNSPRPGHLRALAPFLRPTLSPWMVGDMDTERVRTHRYDLRRVGDTPDGARQIFAAVWAGPEA